MRMPIREQFHFFTDTAALAVFDLECLRHRTKDAPDWWTIPWVAADEINEGNCAIFDLQSDGSYTGTIEEVDDDQIENEPNVVGLHVRGGRVFLGAAEEISSGGLEPNAIRGGLFLLLRPGDYLLAASKTPDNDISIRLKMVAELVRNQFLGYVPTTA
jgi:hypothetical protein